MITGLILWFPYFFFNVLHSANNSMSAFLRLASAIGRASQRYHQQVSCWLMFAGKQNKLLTNVGKVNG
uniref:Putative secreted protein n=1 Tax=Anopheles darlingi TaxID=43151 RepID=A0A2M4DJU3_ANODA